MWESVRECGRVGSADAQETHQFVLLHGTGHTDPVGVWVVSGQAGKCEGRGTMTVDEKKAYLGRYRLLDRQVQRTVDEISRWKSRAAKVTPSYSSEPNGSTGDDRLQVVVEQIVELEARANQQIEELLTWKRDIEAAVATVEDKKVRLLLQYRYIDGLTWESIAQKMGYNERWIYQLHRQALTKVMM